MDRSVEMNDKLLAAVKEAHVTAGDEGVFISFDDWERIKTAIEEERGHQRTPRVCVDPSCLDDSDHATHEATPPLEEFDVAGWLLKRASAIETTANKEDRLITGIEQARIHQLRRAASAFTHEVGTVWRRKG